jgi:hypothetical protein
MPHASPSLRSVRVLTFCHSSLDFDTTRGKEQSHRQARETRATNSPRVGHPEPIVNSHCDQSSSRYAPCKIPKSAPGFSTTSPEMLNAEFAGLALSCAWGSLSVNVPWRRGIIRG